MLSRLILHKIHIMCVKLLFILTIKKSRALGSYPKGQFCKNTVYLERGMPYFAFVSTNVVLVKKIDRA